jgi:hypothetical protein
VKVILMLGMVSTADGLLQHGNGPHGLDLGPTKPLWD